jgi:thioesterase domain-containing protein
VTDDQTSTPTMVDVLTSIWQRVLRRSPIGVDENFFDLGGDPESANRLFHEIAEQWGRNLSPLTIYHAPTIAALAIVLEELAPPRFPPLVRLRAGTEGLPVFLFPGLGGDVMGFFELVKQIRTANSIYGMQSRGIDGVEKPFVRMQDLCHYHFDAIKQLQPRGPYLLVGYSSGGVVALELARRLTEHGDEVGLLAMIDSYPPLSLLTSRQFLKLKVIRQKHRIAAMIRHGLDNSRHRGETQGERPRVEIPVIQAAPNFQEENDYRVLETFQPRFYDGTITFIRAENDWTYPLDPNAIWAPWAKELRVETMPGDHLEMIKTHSATLGAALSRYLQEARSATR